jgi:hypothetical protein
MRGITTSLTRTGLIRDQRGSGVSVFIRAFGQDAGPVLGARFLPGNPRGSGFPGKENLYGSSLLSDRLSEAWPFDRRDICLETD